MSVHIDRLNLRLPSTLAHRKLAITRLIHGELNRLHWPNTSNISQLNLSPLQLSSHHTNLMIARTIAQQIHQHTQQHSRHGQGGIA